MDLLDKIRKYESMHIVFWLLKDTCWMMEFKALGAVMIVPTLFLAVYLAAKTTGTRDFYLNMAILFWIMANSYWMVSEFFFDNAHRHLAGIPFGIGFMFVAAFYRNDYKTKRLLRNN